VKRLFLVLILASCLLAAACTGATIKRLGELQTLHNELTQKFGDQVHVNVNETDGSLVLTVSFVNSALNQKPLEERLKRAAEAAKVVKEKYSGVNKLNVIWVGFLRQRTRMLVFHYSEGLNYFAFDKNAQLIDEPATVTPEPPLETTATYHATRNQSDVFAYGIQLEGQAGKDGVTLVPNFKTTGDVNVKKGPPPKTVQFDFASYSRTPRFDQNVKVTLFADDKPVLETEGTFFGSDAQFCYLPVPYSVFRKLLAAKQVTIKLGDKQYRLTPRQFATLQEMTRYLQE
jgi:hypothetical protein